MRTLSFLLFVFVFIQPASPFSVILRSGKILEATWVGEDHTSIQVKDQSGLVLSFKKSMLDLEAMTAVNEKPPDRIEPPRNSSEPPKSIVQIAEETKKNRTGTARVFTNQDLAQAPELTVLGSAVGNGENAPPDNSAIPSKQERYWRAQALDLSKVVFEIQERRTSAEASCERARARQMEKRVKPHRGDVQFFSLYEDPVECKKLREIDRQLQDARSRMENLEDRARLAGVPWQWLE